MAGDSMFISVGNAAALAGVHVVTIGRWIDAGKLPNTRRTPGGHRRILLADLRAVLRTPAVTR